MIPLQTVVRVAPSVCRHFAQLRDVTTASTVVSVPAPVKISPAENLTHGVLITFGVRIYPVWVLTRL